MRARPARRLTLPVANAADAAPARRRNSDRRSPSLRYSLRKRYTRSCKYRLRRSDRAAGRIFHIRYEFPEPSSRPLIARRLSPLILTLLFYPTHADGQLDHHARAARSDLRNRR
jgi:hypothetical protein